MDIVVHFNAYQICTFSILFPYKFFGNYFNKVGIDSCKYQLFPKLSLRPAQSHQLQIFSEDGTYCNNNSL